MYPGQIEVDAPVQSALASLNLWSLSTDELKTLLNDDERMEEKIKELAEIKAIENNREMLLASNKSLAEYNLSKQPKLMELKSKIREQMQELEQLKEQLREKRDKLSVADQPLDTVLALMQTAAAEAEEETENLVQSMLRGEMTLDNFLELYLPKRAQAIDRRVRTDRMKEMVRTWSSYRPPPPPTGAASATPYSPPAATPVSVPYPAQPAVPYPPAGPSIPYPLMPGAMPLPSRFM